MKHLHSIGTHESGQILTEAALSKVVMWVEMLGGRFLSNAFGGFSDGTRIS
jgi:hypothetical protein